MGNREKLLILILKGTSDCNIPFDALCNLLQFLGFDQRIKGSYYIFTRKDVVEIINIQSKGSLSKPYQIKQIRNLILKYHLGDRVNG